MVLSGPDTRRPTGQGTPGCHIFPVLASGPFGPALSSCRLAHQVPNLLHSGAQREGCLKNSVKWSNTSP